MGCEAEASLPFVFIGVCNFFCESIYMLTATGAIGLSPLGHTKWYWETVCAGASWLANMLTSTDVSAKNTALTDFLDTLLVMLVHFLKIF